MKQLKVAVLALFLVASFSNLNAQDANNRWSVGFGANAIDFYPTNAQKPLTGKWYDEFFNAEDHYNIIPSISTLTVGRYLADGFSINLTGSLNKIEKIGDSPANDLSYFGLDAAIKYDLNKIIGETAWFDPFVTVGGGYTWMDDYDTGTFNGGAGFNVWLNDNLGLNLQTKYKHTFDSAVLPHWQHAAGIVFKFGGADSDGDGIFDKDDACPEVFGLKEFNGCPDTDGDGIIDKEDDCPNVAGLAALKGCPDADGDGIADKYDACPNERGTKANNGCPDTDGDGVIDKEDGCPKVAGPRANKGCPWPDRDGDGVFDKDDKCPDQAGPASNKGCPEMTEANKETLRGLAKTVYFNTGKSTFTNETYATLDKIVSLIKDFSIAKFSIEGHTDSVGRAAFNQGLSEKRANAVRSYLSSKLPNSFTAVGYGETMPIASNKTRSGRAQNRRVEIKLVK